MPVTVLLLQQLCWSQPGDLGQRAGQFIGRFCRPESRPRIGLRRHLPNITDPLTQLRQTGILLLLQLGQAILQAGQLQLGPDHILLPGTPHR